MEAMAATAGRMARQLKQWGAKLDVLVAEAEQAGAGARIDYRKRIEDLRAKHQAMQSKLDEFRAARRAKWESFKTGLESAWNELEVAFTKFTH